MSIHIQASHKASLDRSSHTISIADSLQPLLTPKTTTHSHLQQPAVTFSSILQSFPKTAFLGHAHNTCSMVESYNIVIVIGELSGVVSFSTDARS